MNNNPNQKALMIGMGVVIAALLVAVIVLAVRKNPDPVVPVDGTPVVTPATKTPVTKGKTTNKGDATTPVNPDPVFDPASGTSDFDAYAMTVTKTGTVYKTDFDLVSWQYNPDLTKSFVVNPDEKTRSFELDKALQLSYTSKYNYPTTLDRREVFLDIVNNQTLGPESKLFHAVVKGGKIVSLVQIESSK